MTEVENLFEIYENTKELSRLNKEMRYHNKVYDIDTCVKFLNLLQYHKPLFENEESVHDYNHKVLNLIDYHISVVNRLINIFEINAKEEFPKEVYEVYSKFPHWKVKYYVAGNEYTPKEILEEYVSKGDNEDYMVVGEAKAQLEHRFNIK